MILKVNGQTITFWNSFSVNMKYDSVADSFSFIFYFDHTSALHKQLFRPLQYQTVQVFEGDELILTGTVINTDFEDGPVKRLSTISGYSLTGILEDCQHLDYTPPPNINKDKITEQPDPPADPASMIFGDSNGYDTLYNIAAKLIGPFNLQMIVSEAVQDDMNKPIVGMLTISETKTIKEILQELCIAQNINITHNQYGQLQFSRVNTGQNIIGMNTDRAIPTIWNFTDGAPSTKISLKVNGQGMHSQITVMTESFEDASGGANASTSEPVVNPYVSLFRPRFSTSTRGKFIDSSTAARHYMGEELKNIMLTIEISQWQLNGKIIRPNSIITVTSPENFIYSSTRFFVMEVSLRGDQSSQTCIITCCLPEVFNNDPVNNIFA